MGQKAIVRSELWNPEKRVDRKALPTAGQILAAMSEDRIGGERFDAAYPQFIRDTLW